MNLSSVAAAALITVSAAGCYHHSFTVGTGGDVTASPKLSSWHSHWLFGIIGEEDVKVKEVCPSGNATIKDYHSFVNGLIGTFIGLVWYPTTVEVYCDTGGKAAKLSLLPDSMRRLGRSPRVLESVRAFDPSLADELVAATSRLPSSQPAKMAEARSTSAVY